MVLKLRLYLLELVTRLNTPPETGGPSIATQTSHWATLAAMMVAISYMLAAPILAITWSRNPFPGFLIEQTGVVANIHSPDWSGYTAGIDHPQRLIKVDDRPVGSPAEFKLALANRKSGQTVAIETELPDGRRLNYPAVKLMDFPGQDLLEQFWYPYMVGLFYLGAALVVYTVRGSMAAGRSFAFFCACASIAISATFDTSTTHMGVRLWTFALALLGGSLSGLSILFPEEMPLLYRRAGLRLLAYVISLGLTLWGWLLVEDISRPWAYIQAWRVSYFYMAFSMVFFFAASWYRLKFTTAHIPRQQNRILLFGSMAAFLPISVWMLAPLASLSLPWEPALYILPTIFFPLSVSIAILRYRLWAVDIIIRRTLIYAVLTGLLVAIYFGSVILLQNLVKAFTGETSRLAIVASTLIIASLFRPLYGYARTVIDHRFYRSRYDVALALENFSVFLRDETELENLAGHLVGVVDQSLQPESIAIVLVKKTGPAGQKAWRSD